MAQWISMCTMSVKGLGFKPHGRLQWSFLAEKAFLMTSRSSCYLVLPRVTKWLWLYQVTVTRNCLFNDLTLHLKDVLSTSSCFLVSLMAQWISMCTLTDKGCGFKPHGRLQLSFLAEKCIFNYLTLNLKDVFSTSSCLVVSLMAQWISMYIMSVKGLGFKSHGRLRWSFLAETVSLMTSHFTLRMYFQQVHVSMCPWWLSG